MNYVIITWMNSVTLQHNTSFIYEESNSDIWDEESNSDIIHSCLTNQTFPETPIQHMSYTLQHTATHCNTLQHAATHCNTLQHTATHCNTLQHTEQRPSNTWAIQRVFDFWFINAPNQKTFVIYHTGEHRARRECAMGWLWLVGSIKL